MGTGPGRDTYSYRILRKNWLLVQRQYGNPCTWCLFPIDWDTDNPRSRYAPTVDHLWPLSKGGPPEDTNYWVLAHYSCNSRRGNRITWDPLAYDQHSEAW